MAGRSPNSHELKMRAFPFTARLRREEPFRWADDADWRAAADRIAGERDRWYSWAPSAPADIGCKLIGFATQDQAEAMQRWITESGIETRPAPPKYSGPMLGVAGAKPS
jgi:hypothetical protein